MSNSKIENISMILENNAYFKGTLNTPYSIKINGIFEGKISSLQNVYIGPEAKINGEIQAKSVVISGSVKGNIVAEDKIHLTSTSNFEGEIVTSKFIIDEGAHFIGNCKRTPATKIS